MKRRFLLDTSTLIHGFATREEIVSQIKKIESSGQTPQQIIAAKQKYLDLVRATKRRFQQWIADKDINLAITPLIRFELLRNGSLSDERIAEINSKLVEFDELEIRSPDAQLAARLCREAHRSGAKVDKRNFDALHFASAVNNQLEIDSNDGDLPNIKAIYEKLDHA